MFTRANFNILAAATALALTAGATATQAAEAKGINGRWIMPDDRVLTIHGSEWVHPSQGTATIHRTAGNTFRVDYNSHQGTRCTYRVNTIADGGILVLEAADATQSLDFCPSGKFSRAD